MSLKIILTKNQVAVVDDHWYEYLMQWKWRAQWNKDTNSFYAVRQEGGRKNVKTIYMHRVIANTPEGMVCDHIHHNTLDNRERELRNVTLSQSQMNTKTQKNNKLGIKGVCKPTGRNSYVASLTFQGKSVLRKKFSTIEEAVQARKEAEEKYFGEFSYLGK